MNPESFQAKKELHTPEESRSQILKAIDAAIDMRIQELRPSDARTLEQQSMEVEQGRQDEHERNDAYELTLSRRQFIQGIGVTAALGGSVVSERAAARSIEKELTQEEQELYDNGIQEMRESARTDINEIMRFFISRPDGAKQWVNVSITTQSKGHGWIAIYVDGEQLAQVKKIVVEGGWAQQLHTHPTRVWDDAPIKPRQDITDTPPSPLDIFSSVKQLEDIGSNGYSRLTFKLVTEDGVWSYGPASPHAGAALSRAVRMATPSLRLLNQEPPEARAALASYLAEEYEHNPVIEQIASVIQSGDFDEMLIASPYILSGFAQLLASADIEKIPTAARTYIRLIERASSETSRALRTIAPTTDARVGEPPIEGHFDAYVQRWKQLGFDMTFTPY